MAAILGLVMAGTVAALIIVSQHWARDLGHRVADRSAAALREQALTDLRRFTSEQAERYSAEFERTRTLSQLLATEAEALLAEVPSSGSPPQLDLNARRGMLTNGPDAPVSAIYLRSTTVQPDTRREMARLAGLDPLLQQARQEGFSTVAAWFTSEAGYVRYSPNLPLIETMPDDAAAAVYDTVFYKAAMPEQNPERETVWTHIYQDPAGQGLMVTAATPVYGPEDQFQGVIGVDVTLKDMVQRIFAGRELSRDQDAARREGHFNFLVDGDGRIIAFPLGRAAAFGISASGELAIGETLEHSLLDSENERVAAFMQRAVAGDEAMVTRLQLDGTPYLLGVSRVPSTGWFLGRVVAEEAVMGHIAPTRGEIDRAVHRQTDSLTLLTLALLGMALVGVMVYVMGSLVRPLRRLATATDALRQGRYGVHVPDERTDELGRTGQAFNEMSDRLAGLIQDLEARVAERTAQAEAARHHFQSILENSPVGICFLDNDRYIRQANQAALDLLAYLEEAVVGHTTRHLYAEDSEYRRVGREAYPVIFAGGTYQTISRLRRADGTPVLVSLHGRAVNPEDLSEGFIWVIQDISEEKRLEEELRLLATTFRTNQATFITNADGTIERVNPAFTAITGYSAEEVVGANPRLFKSGVQGPEFYKALWAELIAEGHWEGEIWNRFKDGQIRPLYEAISVVRDADGAIEHFVAVFHDISKQKRLEAELAHQASHDRLTGIPNRKRFEELLETEIARACRYGGSFTLIMFDIDHFKAVNDTYGHHVGDEVLVRIAERVAGELRTSDTLGRWGGEEFMVLLPETSLEAGADLAERLRRAVLADGGDHLPTVALSLGVADYHPGESAEDMTQRLDTALYAAKDGGRNRVERA